MVQVCHVALLPKPISTRGNGEGSAQFRDKECQVATRRGVNDRAQRWVNGNSQFGPGGPLRLPRTQVSTSSLTCCGPIATTSCRACPVPSAKASLAFVPIGC